MTATRARARIRSVAYIAPKLTSSYRSLLSFNHFLNTIFLNIPTYFHLLSICLIAMWKVAFISLPFLVCFLNGIEKSIFTCSSILVCFLNGNEKWRVELLMLLLLSLLFNPLLFPWFCLIFQRRIINFFPPPIVTSAPLGPWRW